MTSAPLHPLSLPLKGVRLIEASAGTGKTWTIAALYLRLVLGHGDGAAEPLLPNQILVLTFTKAATAELRERIRARLAEAAAAFRATTPPQDALLASLLDGYADPQARAIAARRLDHAGQWMDEASIHTIHGWCQRMLQQHAFDSGYAFAQDAQADETQLQAEVIRDYWRRQFFPLDSHGAARIRGFWRSPRELQRALRPLLAQPDESLRLEGKPLPPVDDIGEYIENIVAPERDALRRAQALWRDHIESIESTVLQALRAGSLNANMMKPAAVEQELQTLRAWTTGGPIDETTLQRYTQGRLAKATKKGHAPPMSEAFEAIETWALLREQAVPLEPMILAHAAPWVRARLEALKQQRSQIGFDDMLQRLDRALRGHSGHRLAQTLAGHYPVALIDEFQDTDPLQWRIFERIYGERRDCGLLLIGDPKQAIYSFRGADIHTYLRARDAAIPPIWTLDTNHRSTDAMVDAVNRLFVHGDTHADGAFGFGATLPFQPVAAKGRGERFIHQDRKVPALTFALLDTDEPMSVGVFRHAMAEHAAAQLIAWLDAATQGHCGFKSTDGSLVPLQQGDIAILVRSRGEAALMRDALRRRGLKSVFLSDRDSVYASAQADDLLRWLQACAEPGSDRGMRAALATPSMCRSYAELDRLNADELAWEACGEIFRRLHQHWVRHGVLAMTHELLHAFDLPARLLAGPDGERQLTNLLQLAELLQHAAMSLDGERALIRYLGTRMAESRDMLADTSEEQIVRLESEDALIKIITIHKSKGLEYPLVMLPFIATARQASNSQMVVWHDAEGRSIADLDADDAARQASAREQAQEDLRLLYVALTRARHACWLGIGVHRVGHAKAPALQRSALGYLLSGGAIIEPRDLPRLLGTWHDHPDSIAVETLPEIADTSVYRPREPDQKIMRHATPYEGVRIPEWRIASYSGLKYVESEGHDTLPAPETPAQDNLNEVHADATLAAVAGERSAPAGIHAFERGAIAGTFLHDMFEWVAERGFDAALLQQDVLEQWIAQRAQRLGWTHHAPMLATWLIDLLKISLPLPDGGHMALAGLSKHQYYAELEFWIEAHRVDTLALDQLVKSHTLDQRARQRLDAERIHGMFKGFIDLIVEHKGRYYVIDYKSNVLGPDAQAYTHDAMRNSVLGERYDLQYALYTLALHRQLRARLPGYDYDRHIGGVMYLYLRGVDGTDHGVHNERLPRALIEAMDALFAGGASSHAA
ncbi:exodeoxyribonuclease V subunit beta [Dyella sp.]|uniref:exodeoxyribonuclease V subunit beta n=1 Tax=Dyella sp. TaxID=1869338 RepID=UPI002ED6AA10